MVELGGLQSFFGVTYITAAVAASAAGPDPGAAVLPDVRAEPVSEHEPLPAGAAQQRLQGVPPPGDDQQLRVQLPGLPQGVPVLRDPRAAPGSALLAELICRC